MRFISKIIPKRLKAKIPDCIFQLRYSLPLIGIILKGRNFKPLIRYLICFLGFGEYYKDAPKDTDLKRWTASEWIQYETWLGHHSLKTDNEWYALRRQALSWQSRPLISILTPVYNTKKKYLYECIYSVLTQAYPFWEMCIVDDGSTDKQTIKCLKKFAGQDSRLKLELSPVNQGICKSTNVALNMAQGDYIAFLDHDDRISPDALFYMVEAINNYPKIDILYSDRDMISPRNRRFMHLFKPELAPETLFATNYTCHFTVYRRQLMRKLGGVDAEIEGSQDHDLILRAIETNPFVHHISRVLYHWRQHPDSVALNHNSKAYAYDAAIRAIEKALKRRKLDGEVNEIPELWRGNYRVTLKPPTKETFAVIKLDLHRNGNNFSQSITNKINDLSHKEYLIFLDSSLCYEDENALLELVSWFQIEEIAMVTGKIIDDKNRFLHAGIVHRASGIPLSIFEGFMETEPGYMAASSIARNVSSPHPFCFAIRRTVIETLGGLDPSYKGPYGIFDLAVRALHKKYRIMYTPFARFICKDDWQRAEDWPSDDHRIFLKRWSKWLSKGDPYYNQWLTLNHVDMGLDLDVSSTGK